jgi:hypothetical protein
MTEIIKKLIDRQIFKDRHSGGCSRDQISFGFSSNTDQNPENQEVNVDHCIADEEYEIEANVPYRKIYFQDITMIDGMEPQELAAVYGLAPRTERFKVKKDDK